MKERTQNEYVDTLINTLRIELLNEIKAHRNEEGSVFDELNAHDMLLKQLSMKIDGIQSDAKKISRTTQQGMTKMQLDIDEQTERIRRISDNRGSDEESLSRIRKLERALENFEKKVVEQLEAALNETHDKVLEVEREQGSLKSMVQTTNLMVQKLDQPFKDMREVLIQVTQTLSEMEEQVLSPSGGDTVKSRMSVANKRMLEARDQTYLSPPKKR